MPVAKKTVKKQREPVTSKKYTNMFQAYGAFWRRGFTEWAGTSSRSEYWWTHLVNLLIVIAWMVLLVMAAGPGIIEPDIPLGNVPAVMILTLLLAGYGLAAFVPSLSMTVRRLHDAGLSAWWMMLLILAIIPALDFVISIVFFVFSVLPTEEKGNPYHKFNKVTK